MYKTLKGIMKLYFLIAELQKRLFKGIKMKEFKKWEKKFYAKHRGVYHFDPTREMGWKAALKWTKIKLENYTIDDVLYFIDEELKE